MSKRPLSLLDELLEFSEDEVTTSSPEEEFSWLKKRLQNGAIRPECPQQENEVICLSDDGDEVPPPKLTKLPSSRPKTIVISSEDDEPNPPIDPNVVLGLRAVRQLKAKRLKKLYDENRELRKENNDLRAINECLQETVPVKKRLRSAKHKK